jgi:hypothetical protein
MQDKKKVPFGGGMVDAVSIPYHTTVENWNEYFLDDGTVIRVKTITSEILRVEDQWDEEDNPVYVVKSANFMHVNAPEKLRKGGSS